MNKNEEYEVDIVGYTSDGQGVARLNGFVIFVPFAIMCERVRVHIIKVNKTYAVGKIVEIIIASSGRVEPPCPYFKKCGGCDFQHMNYEKSLEVKKKIVEDAMTRIGGFENSDVKNTQKSDKFYNYRNKSAFPIAIDKNGKARVCMYKMLSHDPVFIDSCCLATDKTNEAIKVFNSFLETLPSEDAKALRYIVIRHIGDKMLFTIVLTKNIRGLNELFEALKSGLGFDEKHIGLFVCKKKVDNNVILEGDIRHILGIEKIEHSLMGVQVDISPMSFFQVNLSIMEKIYESVLENFDSSDTIVDAYSGAGLMSALLAKKVKKVVGIEIVKEATADANKVKEKNELSNLENINGDVNIILPRLAKEIGDFSLVVDPPRKGIEKSVVETIIKSEPRKIVYVSCNPSSLARDVKLLKEGGYFPSSVTPYDMFPETCHVESVVVLKKI